MPRKPGAPETAELKGGELKVLGLGQRVRKECNYRQWETKEPEVGLGPVQLLPAVCPFLPNSKVTCH